VLRRLPDPEGVQALLADLVEDDAGRGEDDAVPAGWSSGGWDGGWDGAWTGASGTGSLP
jgi:hypothetical protein